MRRRVYSGRSTTRKRIPMRVATMMFPGLERTGYSNYMMSPSDRKELRQRLNLERMIRRRFGQRRLP